MAEVLTESFCERCGTRYTFESAQPRVKRLKGVKVLSRGLKNFVLSDDSSLDEAMAAARSDTDREITAMQLDAFHQTFNFCMTCRQYTCANCWNEAEGTCLTCSPHLGREILPAPFPDLDPALGAAHVHAADGANGNGVAATNRAAPTNALELGAWPASDLVMPGAETPPPADDIQAIDASARLAALTALDPERLPIATDPIEAEPEAVAEAVADAPAEATELAAEPIADVVAAEAVAAEVVVEPVVEASSVEPVDLAPAATIAVDPATDEVAAAAAAQTAALLHRFRPGQNLDAEIEAYEREQAAAEAARTTDLADVAAAAVVVGAVTPADEPAEAEVAPAVAAELETSETTDIAPEIAATAPETGEAADAAPVVADETPVEPESHDLAAAMALAAAAARRDIVEQPTWQIVAPDVESTPATPAQPLVPPAPANGGASPEWPAKPEWPSNAPAASGLPFLGRPAQPTGGLDSLWAESNREVASAPAAPGRAQGGVQPCLSCGLSLSATARFCRRCGTSQVA